MLSLVLHFARKKNQQDSEKGEIGMKAVLKFWAGLALCLPLLVFVGCGSAPKGNVMYTGRLEDAGISLEKSIKHVGPSPEIREDKSYRPNECVVYIGLDKGMDFKEVEKQLNSVGLSQISSKAGSKGNRFVNYSDNPNGIVSGMVIQVEFNEKNKLTGKSSDKCYYAVNRTLGMNEYKKIEKGMSYKEVVEIFGAEGFPQLVSDERETKGGAFTTID